MARGESRQENLREYPCDDQATVLIALATVDNPKGDRYSLEIDIISAEIDIEGNGQTFPFIETLKSTVIDHKTR